MSDEAIVKMLTGALGGVLGWFLLAGFQKLFKKKDKEIEKNKSKKID